MKRLKFKLQKWFLNTFIPHAVLDTIWVIMHIMRKIYIMNNDEFGRVKTRNLINALKPLLPKDITEQKIP